MFTKKERVTGLNPLMLIIDDADSRLNDISVNLENIRECANDIFVLVIRSVSQPSAALNTERFCDGIDRLIEHIDRAKEDLDAVRYGGMPPRNERRLNENIGYKRKTERRTEHSAGFASP